MTVREELQKEVDKKIREVSDLNAKIIEANAFIAGLQRAMKALPPDNPGLLPEKKLRPGSDAAKAQEALIRAGQPLHVVEILKAIGKEDTTENKISLSGSLAHYANARQIFVKTAPRTFGLINFPPAQTGVEFDDFDDEEEAAPIPRDVEE